MLSVESLFHVCNVYFFPQAAFKNFFLYLFFTSLTIMCLSVCAHTFVYKVYVSCLAFAELLESVYLCHSPHLGSFLPVISLITFFCTILSRIPVKCFIFFIRESMFFNIKKIILERKGEININWLLPECSRTRDRTLTSAWVGALTGNRACHFLVSGMTLPPIEPHQPEPQ